MGFTLGEFGADFVEQEMQFGIFGEGIVECEIVELGGGEAGEEIAAGGEFEVGPEGSGRHVVVPLEFLGARILGGHYWGCGGGHGGLIFCERMNRWRCDFQSL